MSMRYELRAAALLVFSCCFIRAPWAHAGEFDLQDWEQYIEALKVRVFEEPGMPNNHLRLADAYSQIGDTVKVEEYCHLAQINRVHPARVLALLGEHYLRLNRFDRALSNLLRARSLGPKSATIHLLIWRTLLQFRRSRARRDSVNPVDFQQAAGLLSARGYYMPRSLKQEEAGLPEDPVTARSHLAQGYSALRVQDLRLAFLSFQAAADVSPTLADAYRGMGIVLVRLEQTERALAAYQLFLALAPERTRDVDVVERIVLDYHRRQGKMRR